MPAQQTVFKSGKISYSVHGEGPSLVFLHGFLESQKIWDKFIEPFKSNYQIITIDLPGHGRSSLFKEKHSMEFMAECVHHVLTKLKVTSSIVIGHSMGGYVTLAYAEKYKPMLKGICLFHSHADADSAEKKHQRNQLINLVSTKKDYVIKEMIPNLFANANVTKFKHEIEQLIIEASNMSALAIQNALEGMRDRKPRLNTLKNLTIPTLFILGQEDNVMPFTQIKEQQNLSPLIVPFNLKEVGHMGFSESINHTQKGLAEFISICLE